MITVQNCQNNVWLIKNEMGKSPIIKCDIVKKAQAYKGVNNNCRFCKEEELCILKYPKNKLLNKRSELISKCRLVNKFHMYHLPPNSLFILFHMDRPMAIYMWLCMYVCMYVCECFSECECHISLSSWYFWFLIDCLPFSFFHLIIGHTTWSLKKWISIVYYLIFFWVVYELCNNIIKYILFQTSFVICIYLFMFIYIYIYIISYF